jgi:hypothetical protein
MLGRSSLLARRTGKTPKKPNTLKELTKNRQLYCRTYRPLITTETKRTAPYLRHHRTQRERFFESKRRNRTKLSLRTQGELAARFVVDCSCTAGRPPPSTSISPITRRMNDDAGSIDGPSTSAAWAAGRLFSCVACNHALRDGVWGEAGRD